MGFFDNLEKTITSASQGAIQKGKDMAESAKFNSLIAEEEKKVNNLYIQIGKKYVEEIGNSAPAEYAEYVNLIFASNAKIAEYKQRVKELKRVVQCPSCGAEAAEGTVFCSVCGAKIVDEQAAAPVTGKVCAECGAIVPEGNKFCTSCGSPIE